MRFIVRNMARGSANRVSLGGKPLPPGATRVLLGLTETVSAELRELVAQGKVEVAANGKFLTADFFGQPVVAPALETTDVSSPPAPAEVEEVIVAPVAEPDPAPEVAPVQEEAVSAEPLPGAHTAESLSALRVAELRAILESMIPGASANKNKVQVIDAILAAQGA
jgi:hypothetical protein